MNLSKVVEALNQRGFIASAYDTAEEARSAALEIIGKRSVGSGGSRTIGEMNLLPRLMENGNVVYCHSLVPEKESKTNMRSAAMLADVYLSSSNAITEDGSLYNIEGTGNRIAALLFGPKTVIVIAGRNKIVGSVEEGLERTRKYCCPNNARRLKLSTPCAKTDVCTDCTSPDRMCRAFVTLANPTRHTEKFYVLLVDQDLGW